MQSLPRATGQAPVPSPTAQPLRVLQDGWAQYRDAESDRTFYYHAETETSAWKPPRGLVSCQLMIWPHSHTRESRVRVLASRGKIYQLNKRRKKTHSVWPKVMYKSVSMPNLLCQFTFETLLFVIRGKCSLKQSELISAGNTSASGCNASEQR